MITSREKILKNVRTALTGPKEVIAAQGIYESQIMPTPKPENFAKSFADAASKNGVSVFNCANRFEFLDLLITYLDDCGAKKTVVLNRKIQDYLDSCDYPYLSKQLDIINADARIAACDYLVANTGAMVFCDRANLNKSLITYPEIHITVAFKEQLVMGLQTVMEKIKLRYDQEMPSTMLIMYGTNHQFGPLLEPRDSMFGARKSAVFIINER